MKMRSTLVTAALLCLAVALPGSSVLAQQKQQVSFKVPAENSKFTQQLTIEVGDTPNHVVRVFEIRYTFPNNAPVINGLKLVEEWDRGFGDRIDGSGPATIYTVYVMENGDKFFIRSVGVVQNTGGKLTNTVVGNITGGTGKFAGIQGSTRSLANFNYNTGFVEPQIEIEYWIGK
jgi:hypothetical protein